jgi:hypothetical protein
MSRLGSSLASSNSEIDEEEEAADKEGDDDGDVPEAEFKKPPSARSVSPLSPARPVPTPHSPGLPTVPAKPAGRTPAPSEPLKPVTDLSRVACAFNLPEHKATFDKNPEVQPRVKISAFEYAAGLECLRLLKPPHIGIRPLTECIEIIDVKSFAAKAVHSAAPEPEVPEGRAIPYFNTFYELPLISVVALAALAGPPAPAMSHPKDRRRPIQWPEFSFIGSGPPYTDWFGTEGGEEDDEAGEPEDGDQAGEEEDDT